MADTEFVAERSVSGVLIAAVAVALLVAVGALIWCRGLQNHLGEAEQRLKAGEQKSAELTLRLQATESRLRATTETLGQSVGMTQNQIETKTRGIMAAQKTQAVKLEQTQAAAVAATATAATAEKQIGAVSTDVANVKTDVVEVKTDVATAKTDLESTKLQLSRVMGDAGVMSGLIARNQDELELLKHKGDRNYYEFTLQKGAKPLMLSTVKLQLKKVDDKHSRYTLVVSADDRNIEKKDKSLDEPLQFYSGKDPALYELVVNLMAKNQVSGYLSTPKDAVQPSAAPAP